MEEAAELGNYLPLSFKSPKEQEYIAFLWDAFESSFWLFSPLFPKSRRSLIHPSFLRGGRCAG